MNQTDTFLMKDCVGAGRDRFQVINLTSTNEVMFESDQWSGDNTKQIKLQKTGIGKWAEGKHRAVLKVSVGRTETQTETKTPKVSLWGECFMATQIYVFHSI